MGSRSGYIAVALLALCLLSGRAEGEPKLEETSPGSAMSQVTAPVLLTHVEPTYPKAALEAGAGGTVSLQLTIETDGTVSKAQVTNGVGFGLDEAAAEAARAFKFKTATRNGEAVASIINFDQTFVPRQDAPSLDSARDEPGNPYETTVVARGPMTAASAESIRNLDFDLRPKTSPNDILNIVPGLLAVQHQGGGKADQLFLRGFDADHGTDVGVFVDGVPVNLPSHAHGQGFADLHWLIPEAIDSMDVVKGPYDVRYGDFSTAGAVNINTRKSFDESSVQFTVGGFPTIDGRLLASDRFVGIAAPQLTGSLENFHPWLAFEVATDQGPFQNPEKLTRYNLFGKVSYDFSPRTSVGVFFQGYSSGWIGSGQIPQRLVEAGQLSPFGSVDPSEGGQSQREMLTVFFRHADAVNELEASFYVTHSGLSLWNDFTFFLRDPVNGDEIEQDDDRVFAGGHLAWHFHRKLEFVSLRTTFGGDIRFDSIHTERWRDTSQGTCDTAGQPAPCFRQRLARLLTNDPLAFGGSNDAIGQSNLSGYVEEDAVFNRYLRVVAALRADYFGFNVTDLNQQPGTANADTSGVRQVSLLSPKASAVITPLPGTLELYLNYGNGFHSNMAEVALLDGAQLKGSDGTSFTVHAVPRFYGGELGARAHLFDRVDVAAAFWGSYLQNETVFDADNAVFVPSYPTRRLGVDVEARVQLLDWLWADADLAQATATTIPDNGAGGELALAPKLYMTGGLTVKWNGFRGGLRFRYLGPRPAFDESSPEYRYFTSKTLANGSPNPDYDPSRVTAQGYFLVDAYASYRWRFLEVSLTIQNLLNTTWREAQFGNRSCTADETYNPTNPNYAGSGNQLSDGTFVDRCGASYGAQRSGVVDVHYTPGVPFNPQLTLKAYL